MDKHGLHIENCPRCGKHGLLIERSTVTKTGDKKYTYKRWNVAHYQTISKNGKMVSKIQWCYINAEQIKELQTHGVTQTVTQTDTNNETRDSNVFQQKNDNLKWTGWDLNPRPPECK